MKLAFWNKSKEPAKQEESQASVLALVKFDPLIVIPATRTPRLIADMHDLFGKGAELFRDLTDPGIRVPEAPVEIFRLTENASLKRVFGPLKVPKLAFTQSQFIKYAAAAKHDPKLAPEKGLAAFMVVKSHGTFCVASFGRQRDGALFINRRPVTDDRIWDKADGDRWLIVPKDRS